MKQNIKTKELKHNRRYYIKWIWNQYKEYKKMIFLLLILTIFSTVIAVLFPVVFKYIVDGLVRELKEWHAGNITLDAAKAERNKMLLILLAMGIGPIFSGIYPYLRAKMNITFEMYFREKFFSEILSKGHDFFLEFRTGDLLTRLTEDIRTWPPGLSWLCCSGIFRAVNSASIIFFCLVSMALLNYKLAIIACIPLPIMLVIFIKLEHGFGSSFKRLQTGMSESNDFLEAAYAGIKIIASFNSQKPQTKKFHEIMNRRIDMEVDVDTMWGVFMVYFEFLNYIGEVAVLIFGGIMVINGGLSLGTYYAFFSYLGMIVYPLTDIPMLLVTLTQACVAIDRLEEIKTSHSAEIDFNSDKGKALDEIRTLEMKDVNFVYKSAENTDKKAFSFTNINLKINRGEKIAVVGKIGSGKTTLLNMIAGIIKPDNGSIFINDESIDDIAQRSFRQKVGYIQQEPMIFSETISTNIDFWRGIHSSVVENCTKIAQFEDEVLAFPGGYQEKVGQRGVTLSGGQRQRLSIARALVNSPELLLMDDVTASLDAANEKTFWNDLNEKYKGLSCVIVTHRISTAVSADRIVVLDDGKIIDSGTHDELIGRCQVYRELAH